MYAMRRGVGSGCAARTLPGLSVETRARIRQRTRRKRAAPTPADLARFFPELEILELIGRGGMGAVYKARQKRLDRLVALKVLPALVKRDPAFAERFAREARALARLAHPNIVAVYDELTPSEKNFPSCNNSSSRCD